MILEIKNTERVISFEISYKLQKSLPKLCCCAVTMSSPTKETEQYVAYKSNKNHSICYRPNPDNIWFNLRTMERLSYIFNEIVHAKTKTLPISKISDDIFKSKLRLLQKHTVSVMSNISGRKTGQSPLPTLNFDFF